MAFIRKIYDHSPIFVQNVFCTLSGWVVRHHSYTKQYWNDRVFCKGFDGWTLDKQLDYQNRELIQFIRYAYDNSPFYSKLYKDVDLTKIKTAKDLSILPIVNKELLRSNIDQVVTKVGRKGLESNTSGTTGKSLTVKRTIADLNMRMAILDNFKSRVGFENLKMRKATFSGKHIVPPKQKSNVYWRYNAASKQMFYSTFHLTEDKIGYYIDSLNSFKPQAIDGYFTSICDVAKYIERHALTLHFKPIAVFPTSETLNEEGRELIERVFKCKVYDQYASSEGAPFITECKNQVLHLQLNTGVFEFMDDGEAVVTSFTTHGTPLIRYAIGDRMEVADSSERCGCGLCGPIIKKIQGRCLDYLLKPDGARIYAASVANILKYMPNSVIRSQFIQNHKNEITILLEVDRVLFREESKAAILKECLHAFGDDMIVNIRIVDEIPRTSSGKYRMIINNTESGT